MALIARVIGVSLFTSGVGVLLGLVLFEQYPDRGIVSLCLACVGGIVGGVAGAAREVVTALREPPGPG